MTAHLYTVNSCGKSKNGKILNFYIHRSQWH